MTTTAHADAVFIVNTVADLVDDNTADGVCHTGANTCSLRAAIMEVNHLPPAGVGVISVPAGTYILTRAPTAANGDDVGDLNIVAPSVVGLTVSLIGAGAGRTIIDGNQLDRVLAIDGVCTVRLAGVTIRNGQRGGNSLGGGIFNRSTLTIADSTIENNHADEGGGIDSGGDLTIVRSTIRANTAMYGGGLYVYGPTHIRDSTISGNLASPGSGGGLFNTAELWIVNGTISGNAADTDGGGIYSNYRTSLYSTSIINNDADHDRDENGGIGGGVFAGAFLDAQFLIINTLFAGNTLFDAPIYDDCSGTLDAVGFNEFGDPSGCTINGPWGGVTPGSIGPLRDNGGPTFTHALLEGSEAVDNVFASSSCVDDDGEDMPTDQRGAVRVTGTRCDIGAFEYGSILDRIFANGFD
ncbi:MAG: choice-of-anchor Q domain-containing protein [Dokdonella sp.]|uniref:choice-of-anchor Q domain-containing protein n=1 Tax=Dokdonella sp. TaxID=2291710 RepID=UPI003266D6C9